MDRITILDTTLRDGEQAPGFHLTPEQKLRLARQLRRLSVDVIEAGFPASSPAEFEAVASVAAEVGAGPGAPVIAAFGRSVESDLEACANALRRAARARIHTFIATSDLHLEHKLRLSRREALRRAVAAVRFAASRAADVQFSAEDSFRSDRDFLAEVLHEVIEAGATTVNICDTVGYAMPEEFAALVADMRRRVPDMSRVTVSVHCHDDLGQAVANTLAAVKVGARQVEGTINGIGERAGNAALEEVVMALRTRGDFFGVSTGVNAAEIAASSRMLSEVVEVPVAPNKAIVGANAFAHASGIHQDGMLKHPGTYEIMRPADVGFEETLLPLTARSGRAALEHRLARIGRKTTSEEMPELFRRFKSFADTKRFVSDEDLKGLAGL